MSRIDDASGAAGHRDDDVGRAAARRAFIRASHPDVGGDPVAFIEGLARFDERPDTPPTPAGRPAGRPLVHRSRRPDRVVKKTIRDLRRRLAGLPPRRLQ